MLAQRGTSILQRLRTARNRASSWRELHSVAAQTIILLVLVSATAFGIPYYQAWLELVLATDTQLASLRSLFLTLGGGLLGAAAIVSSLVLFAVQVNVERMPHGLFVRLSKDRMLLGAFSIAFLCAVAIASLSLVVAAERIGVTAFLATWGVVVILSLFLISYRRALRLVNPIQQLVLVTQQAQRELRKWGRRADLLEKNEGRQRKTATEVGGRQASAIRITYFQRYSSWSQEGLRSIRYATSLGRRYAEQGDYEVSAQAMRVIVDVNRAYVGAKGRAFMAEDFVFENSLARDGFIVNSLEQLRQIAHAGIARGDERQIEQALEAMSALVQVYLGIDYGSEHSSRSHAQLGVGYLAGEIERVVPHAMPDVLMTGLRLMGSCGVLFLASEGPNGIAVIVRKTGEISRAVLVREGSSPILRTGVEQLSRLSVVLLHTRRHGVRLAAQNIRSEMNLVARLVMALPDSPVMGNHLSCLAPYYSTASGTSLVSHLAQLASKIDNAPLGDEAARQIAENIAEWADGSYQSEKELLRHAIEKRSLFASDLIQWIAEISTALLRIANSPACSTRLRENLLEEARWLISVLSWVPDDVESVTFVERFLMTETLFEVAIDAHRLGCSEHSGKVCDLLLAWAFKGGRYETGWAVLERSIYGLATLVLLANDAAGATKLREQVAARVAAGELAAGEVRDRVALEIRTRAASLDQHGHRLSAIEREMARVNPNELRGLLVSIANLISPNTEGEILVSHVF